MGVPTRIIKRSMFGKPVLEAGGVGKAAWTTTEAVASDNHQVTYAAKLDAGIQTSWNDFAKVIIPVNEMPFIDIDSVRLEAYYSTTVDGCIDMGVCLYLHDPADLDQRIELSHTPKTSSTTAGWRELNYPTNPQDEGLLFFWYGDESVITEVLTEGTGYSTLAQFQADAVFKSWTIYKITLDYGYHTGDIVMNDCYLAQAIISYGTASGAKVRESILLEPSSEEQISNVTDKTTNAIKSLPAWKFGNPTLEAGGNGKATWSQSATASVSDRTAWSAKLDAGVQSGWNDYAKVVVPINEIPFPDLDSVRLQAKYTVAVGQDMAVCVYIHDPDNLDNRVEVSHTPYTNSSAATRELNFPTEPGGISWFWYGTSATTPGTCTTEGSAYTWAQFQADSVFSTWNIYKITLDYGYYTGNSVMNGCYLLQAQINDVVIPLEPSIKEQLDITRDDLAKALTTIPTWTFGEPFLRHSVAGEATWSRWHHQKGAHGWTAKLYGGVQTSYNDWAHICIPVNEMLIGDLTSALWTWNNTEEEANGLGMAIYIHDPDDNDLRVEMTQLAAHADVEKAAGWLAHELNVATDYFYWYGEDGAGGGSDITEGVPNYAGLDDFQADPLFGRWTIYRIDFYWGGQTGSEEYKDIWVADIKINGVAIPIKPDSSGTGRIGRKFYTGAGNLASGEAKLAPKTPYRLLSISMHLNGQQTSASSFVVSLLSEQGTNYDPALLTDDMDVPAGKVSLYAPFGQGYEFGMDDELDLVYTNGGTKTYGLTYTYEVL